MEAKMMRALSRAVVVEMERRREFITGFRY